MRTSSRQWENISDINNDGNVINNNSNIANNHNGCSRLYQLLRFTILGGGISLSLFLLHSAGRWTDAYSLPLELEDGYSTAVECVSDFAVIPAAYAAKFGASRFGRYVRNIQTDYAAAAALMVFVWFSFCYGQLHQERERKQADKEEPQEHQTLSKTPSEDELFYKMVAQMASGSEEMHAGTIASEAENRVPTTQQLTTVEEEERDSPASNDTRGARHFQHQDSLTLEERNPEEDCERTTAPVASHQKMCSSCHLVIDSSWKFCSDCGSPAVDIQITTTSGGCMKRPPQQKELLPFSSSKTVSKAHHILPLPEPATTVHRVSKVHRDQLPPAEQTTTTVHKLSQVQNDKLPLPEQATVQKQSQADDDKAPLSEQSPTVDQVSRVESDKLPLPEHPPIVQTKSWLDSLEITENCGGQSIKVLPCETVEPTTIDQTPALDEKSTSGIQCIENTISFITAVEKKPSSDKDNSSNSSSGPFARPKALQVIHQPKLVKCSTSTSQASLASKTLDLKFRRTDSTCIGSRLWPVSHLTSHYPPAWGHPNKKLIADIALLPPKQDESGSKVNGGWMRASRWSKPAALPKYVKRAKVYLENGTYSYDTSGATQNHMTSHWHLNFAGARLFQSGAGSGLVDADELKILEHPCLASLALAMDDFAAHGVEGLSSSTYQAPIGPTPILIKGALRSCIIDTNKLSPEDITSASEEEVRSAISQVDVRTTTNIVTLPTVATQGQGKYTLSQIKRLFIYAYTGFRALVLESAGRRAVLHTGFWGCGDGGHGRSDDGSCVGDKGLMAAIQILAAGTAGVRYIHFTPGNNTEYERTAIQHGVCVANALHGEGFHVAAKVLVESGYTWSESDGVSHLAYQPPKDSIWSQVSAD